MKEHLLFIETALLKVLGESLLELVDERLIEAPLFALEEPLEDLHRSKGGRFTSKSDLLQNVLLNEGS